MSDGPNQLDYESRSQVHPSAVRPGAWIAAVLFACGVWWGTVSILVGIFFALSSKHSAVLAAEWLTLIVVPVAAAAAAGACVVRHSRSDRPPDTADPGFNTEATDEAS